MMACGSTGKGTDNEFIIIKMVQFIKEISLMEKKKALVLLSFPTKRELRHIGQRIKSQEMGKYSIQMVTITKEALTIA